MKPLPIICLLALSFLMSTAARGQDIYAVTFKGIYQLDANNTLQFVAALDSTIIAVDLALSQTGKFYAVSSGRNIFEIDLTNNTSTALGSLPFTGFGSSSLVCGANDDLYLLNQQNELWRFDINTGTSTLITNLGYTSPGDITFYKGNIVFQNNSIDKIMAYNLTTGVVTAVICQGLPLGSGAVWGIATIHQNCKTERVIASDWDNNFYELNIDSNTTNSLPVNTSALIPGEDILGLASISEPLGSICPSINLPNASCNTVLTTSELEAAYPTVFYPNPNRGTLYIDSKLTIESIALYDLTGKVVQIYYDVAQSVDLGAVPQGVYLIKATTEMGPVIQRLIIE